ncbi:MAG: CopG family ribbon-helix-helix protein [Promethearchaeota archaeon]
MGDEHSHEHQNISQQEHSEAHNHVHIEEMIDKNYFHYQDTDLIKLNHIEHAYHDIVSTKLHVHTAHERCLIIIPIKGSSKRIREFYSKIISLKSVLSHNIIIEE